MLKATWINLLILPTILLAGECNYKKLSFKSGEPYLKLEVKKDTNQWIGITNLKFAEVLKTYGEKARLDSLVVLYKNRSEICDENQDKYESIVKLLDNNETIYVNLVADYKKFSTKMYNQMIEAEGKKYTWGLVGTTIGFCGGIVLTVLLTAFVSN